MKKSNMKKTLSILLGVVWTGAAFAAVNSSPNTSGTAQPPANPNGTLITPGTTHPATGVNTNQNSWNSNSFWTTNKAPGSAVTNQPNPAFSPNNNVVPAWSNQTPPIVGTNQLSPGQPIPMSQ